MTKTIRRSENKYTSTAEAAFFLFVFVLISSVVLNFKAVPLDMVNNLALVALPDAPAPRAQMIWQRWRARRFENSDIKVLIIRPPFHFPASN